MVIPDSSWKTLENAGGFTSVYIFFLSTGQNAKEHHHASFFPKGSHQQADFPLGVGRGRETLCQILFFVLYIDHFL